MRVNGWHIPDSCIPEVPAEALPAPGLRWRALELTSPEQVRVVLLGQDPYPQPGKATGLAFGLPPGWPKVNSSIENIAREVWGPDIPEPGDEWYSLEAWARQGVLLLNTQLSVMPEQPLSHKGKWDAVVDCILRQALRGPSPERPGVVRLAFGAEARKRLVRYAASGSELVATSHPCKFSAGRRSTRVATFRGSRVFDEVNTKLPSFNQVDWKAYSADLRNSA